MDPQLIPAGAEVTVPLPVPVLLTVRVKRRSAKAAVTDLDPLIVTLHAAALAESHPVQASNLESATGDAVSVNAVPLL